MVSSAHQPKQAWLQPRSATTQDAHDLQAISSQSHVGNKAPQFASCCKPQGRLLPSASSLLCHSLRRQSRSLPSIGRLVGTAAPHLTHLVGAAAQPHEVVVGLDVAVDE